MSKLRSLPSVDKLLQKPQAGEWITYYGRPLTLEAIRVTLDLARAGYCQKESLPSEVELLYKIQTLLELWNAATLLPVINASGVILHTNLGRAPLSKTAMQYAREVAQGYSNLEYDLSTGKRGSRLIHAEALLVRLTGAKAAMVVNNNAAAVLLILSTLATRRGVVIARSQLVEIGGGFRVPDVMKQSGAKLIEIGTTNRVHLSDYKQALEENPALFLRAHRSNFQILGFTSEPSLEEIVGVAHQAGLPVIDDLGSGSLLDTSRYGLGHEPMVQESLQAGVDLVCISGDKLLGGPQAGIILGRAEMVTKLKKHPLARAIRADKLALATLTATLQHYLRDEAEREIPIWRMIAAPLEELHERVLHWEGLLQRAGVACEIVRGESTVGGGSLPGETLPTHLLAIATSHPDKFLARLRKGNPPVVARVQENKVLFDPRTVLEEQDEVLLRSIAAGWMN